MDLEKLATSAIEKEIAKTDLLSSFINSGDKEPCWDGHIYIHEDKNKTKKNIKKVAAQVKGKAVRTRDAKRTISYPISCDDLRAYMMNGGTVFFVVYLNKDTGDVLQIYYVSLLPVIVKKLLDEKNGRRTISVKFHKFPADNTRKTELFLNFYDESKKQVSFAGKDLPNVDDLIKKGVLENISFSYTGLGACPDSRLLPKIIDGKSLTLYANIKGGTAPIPIEYFDEITNITTSKDTNIPISVKGHVYYDKVKTIATADTIEQQIGSSVKIIAPNVDKVDSSIKIHLSINLTGTLTEQIAALEFIIALVDNEAFNFGDAEFPAKFPQSELDRMEACNFPEMLSDRKHVKEVLDSMNVKTDLELSKCTSDDIDNLKRIVDSIGDHRIIRGEIDEKNPGQKIKIANLTVAVVYIKANGGYRIYDFFGNRFDVKWAPEGMTYYIYILVYIVVLIARLMLMKEILQFPISIYFKEVIGKILLPTMMAIIGPFYVCQYFEVSITRVFIDCLFSILWTGTFIMLFGLTKGERITILRKLKSVIVKIAKKLKMY